MIRLTAALSCALALSACNQPIRSVAPPLSGSATVTIPASKLATLANKLKAYSLKACNFQLAEGVALRLLKTMTPDEVDQLLNTGFSTFQDYCSANYASLAPGRTVTLATVNGVAITGRFIR
jgi:hypothetical protein